MSDLISNRKKFIIPADGAVEICVEMRGDSGESAKVFLRCLSCGDDLEERKEKSLFECPSCGFETTFHEAGLLAQGYVNALRNRFSLPELNRRRGLLWRFISLFASNQKRLPAPRS